MPIAGVDVGTTGCKCTIYENDGALISEAYAEYEYDPEKGGRELNPKMVWENVKKVIRESATGVEGLMAICITSFGEAAVLLDEQDKPVTNTLLYTDSRGEEQCRRLVEKLGAKKIEEITGLSPHNNFSISKIMWIRENRPECYKRAVKIFLYADYIAYMLCKNPQMDYSLAARTMAFDFKKLSWSQEILDAAGIDRCLMPPLAKIGSVSRTVCKEVAAELGIAETVMIVSGCHDQIAAAVGTGIFEEGLAVDGAGTVECITPVFSKNVDYSQMIRHQFAIVPYVFEEKFISYAYSFTGGALLKWYRDKLAYLEAKSIKEKGGNPYDVFNGRLKDEISELLILPHFAGAATPYMDSDSRGAIVGLTLETESIDIYQALMEAVAFEMRLNVELMEQAGVHITKLRACGGGALSKQWLQMKADILNLPITSLGAVQSGTLGCAMLAGVACGLYKDLQEAGKIFIRIGDTVEPRSKKHQAYSEKYMRYKRMYPAVKSILQSSKE